MTLVLEAEFNLAVTGATIEANKDSCGFENITEYKLNGELIGIKIEQEQETQYYLL